MKTSATNRRLHQLLAQIGSGTLDPTPVFQRRLVWSSKHRNALIKTVLEGYPFPEIYVAAGELDRTTGESKELLVDGQQRMTTLYQYFTGASELRLASDVPPYGALTDQQQMAFLEYEVVIRDLGRRTIEEIREIFKRINSTNYSLNAMEIHNARYAGAYKLFGDRLAEHCFFGRYRVFSPGEIRRMQDTRFALVLTSTALSSYFNRDSELEQFLERYNDEFPGEKEVWARFDRVFALVEECDLASTRRVWQKADLLTLLVELYRALFTKGLTLDPGTLGMRLRQFYAQVDGAAHDTDASPDCLAYYRAALQASNDRRSRIVRAGVLAQVLGSAALHGSGAARPDDGDQ